MYKMYKLIKYFVRSIFLEKIEFKKFSYKKNLFNSWMNMTRLLIEGY